LGKSDSKASVVWLKNFEVQETLFSGICGEQSEVSEETASESAAKLFAHNIEAKEVANASKIDLLFRVLLCKTWVF
jgi:hypothetical protein